MRSPGLSGFENNKTGGQGKLAAGLMFWVKLPPVLSVQDQSKSKSKTEKSHQYSL